MAASSLRDEQVAHQETLTDEGAALIAHQETLTDEGAALTSTIRMATLAIETSAETGTDESEASPAVPSSLDHVKEQVDHVKDVLASFGIRWWW